MSEIVKIVVNIVYRKTATTTSSGVDRIFYYFTLWWELKITCVARRLRGTGRRTSVIRFVYVSEIEKVREYRRENLIEKRSATKKIAINSDFAFLHANGVVTWRFRCEIFAFFCYYLFAHGDSLEITTNRGNESTVGRYRLVVLQTCSYNGCVTKRIWPYKNRYIYLLITKTDDVTVRIQVTV